LTALERLTQKKNGNDLEHVQLLANEAHHPQSTRLEDNYLGNEFIVIGQVSATVDTRISAVAVGQVGLERLDHLARAAAIAQTLLFERIAFPMIHT
jgi:hypothetical protein